MKTLKMKSLQICALGLLLLSVESAHSFWQPTTRSMDPLDITARLASDPLARNPWNPSSNHSRSSVRHQQQGCGYYGYRYYNASAGRWLNRDPILENGGANLYAFVRNAPAGHTDALGKCVCRILSPLRAELATPRQLGYLSGSLSDQAVWQGAQSRVWFKVTATFANECCQFRQRYRSQASVGGVEVENLVWQDDTDYQNGKYDKQSDGTVQFSDWDNPGWEQGSLNPNNQAFGGTKYLYGYVVDVCNHDDRVGPTLFYGFTAVGTPPNIEVNTWGL
jgi:RHS repeat-associated protein